ncbi:MAG: glycosyltransferase family 39 protein [Janthinobacterium lividum]
MKHPFVRFTRTHNFIAVTTLLLIFALQLVHVARLYSANWDEAHHLYDGYNIWTKHDYRLNAEVPPLVKLTAALPLLSMHLQAPRGADKSQGENAFLDGRTFVFGNGGDRVLFPARMACMGFSLLLAVLIYAAGRRMFGISASLAALTLFVFDPNVLAHGTLVSTDLGSALFLFAAVFAFYRYAQAPRHAWFLATGLLAGLAMVTKFTGILIVPMLVLLCVAEAIRLRSLRVRTRLAACAGMLLIGWIVLWGFYGFRYAAAPNGLALSPPLAPYIASTPGKTGASKLAFAARYHLLPEAYLWGLANTKHTEWEYTSFFFGRLYRHGPWQYFPAAFLIKSTLPLLLLLVLAPVLWFRTRARHAQELVFLLLPVCVYFAVVTMSHFDIGARHLMPIYPFLYVLAGAAAALAFRSGRVWATVAAALLLWQVVTSVRVGPAYMAYGNEAWGGPLGVRNYLSDANVDWGQQLKSVKQYLDANGITNCWFAYFPDGAVQPQDYGISCHRLPTPSGLWWLNLPMDVPPVINGTVLISESDLEGVESGDGPLNPYDAFRGMKPAAILQDGVYVYQGTFAVPLASAWVDVRRSGELVKAGQMQAALGMAQQAVELAPNSARTQSNFAGLLAARGDWNGAFAHYEAANHFLQANRPELEEDDSGPGIRAGLASAEAHLHGVTAQGLSAGHP